MTMPGNTSGGDSGVGYSYATSMVGTGSDTTPWDPSAIQDMINTELEQVKVMLANKEDPSFALYYVMFLMQQYGVQKVGQQADMQNHMNKYFSDIQDAWNMLHSANAGATDGDDTVTKAFLADIRSIITRLTNDPFFNSSPERQQMAAEIKGNANSIISLVTGLPSELPVPGGVQHIDQLWWLWQAYQGNSNPAWFTSGDHLKGVALMDQLNRSMGQLDQQFTGESQAVGAITQAEAKTQQAEQDQMNNFAKALSKLQAYINQQLKTS